MPSFLTKVFGRKKDEKDVASTSTTNKRLSHPSLLEGKYEVVSPPLSPSVVQSSDPQPPQPAGAKESSLAVFRNRSRTIDKPQPSNVASASAPHLTLNLPIPKEEKSRALGVVFEADPESSSLLTDEVIGDRRLSPLEAALLVKACSSAIVDRGGLESLGLMHPHWYSASPEVQRKLISLFILSFGPRGPASTLSPSPTSLSAIFESELNYTRDPHDIASILRWGVRHLRLEGSSFGKDAPSPEWSWYRSFVTAERDTNYPLNAFSQSLVPLLPPVHLQLLTALLDIMSSLAAHSELIGTSASKLSKLFGLWLVSTERAKPSESWVEFYKRWEQAGRMVEHLFLAYIREEDSGHKMPLRLSELVKQYPYHREGGSASSKDDLPLLPTTRFSTRQRDALFIQLDTLLPTPSSPYPSREHPLRLISEALRVPVASDTAIAGEANTVWQDIKAKASDTHELDGAHPTLSEILDDETLRLLSMIPAGQPGSSSAPSPASRSVATSSPSTSLLQPSESPVRIRSASVGSPNGDSKSNDHNGTALSLTTWADFSTTGFGDSSIGQSLSLTLADSDAEKTNPSGSLRRWPSPTRGRSTTLDPTARKSPGQADSAADSKAKSTIKRVSMVQVDEAFFDFWSDALLDPISFDWPSFVVCQLKDSAWNASLLVIEQTFSRPSPPPLPPVPNAERREMSPRPSTSASVTGRKSFTFSPPMKRFSFFNTANRAEPAKGGAKKTGTKSSNKSPRIGELGEILPEEEELPVARAQPTAPELPAKPVQGLGLPTVEEQTSTTPAPSAKAEAALPAVPVVEAEAPEAPAEVAPVATEPIKTEAEAPEKPTVSVPANAEDVVIPADTDTPAAEGEATEKTLPPAPEPVVLTGGTPGPEVALSSSEPAAIAHVAEVAQVEEPAAPEPEASAVEDATASHVESSAEEQAEEQTVEGSTVEGEPQQSGGPAVVSAFTEHLNSSDELQPSKSAIVQPRPTVEEEIAAETGAEFSELVSEPAAVAGAATAAVQPIQPVSETVTHDTVPEVEAKEATQANGLLHHAKAPSQVADDTRDPHSHIEEASV